MKASKIIRERKEDIINLWLQALRAEIPEAFNHGRSAIKNDLPELLDAIAASAEMANQDVHHHSQEHGLNRNHFPEYSLIHVIKEYRLFKQTIFKVLDPNTGIEPYERDSIMNIVDEAIEQACETFFRLRQKVQIDAREIAEQKADQLQIEDILREDFIQSLSHDLNNPLNNIKLCIEMMQREKVRVQDVGNLLTIITSNINKVEILLADFLEIKKVNAHGLPIQKEDVNVGELISNEVDLYDLTNNKNIRLEMPEGDLYAKVDSKVLTRAFENLMNNAIKHGDDKREVLVKCCIKNDRLFISVKNQGPEIPTDKLDEIFNKYYTSEKDGRKAWGIGLSMVRAAANAHGGEVKVKSSAEEGTQFTLILPVE